MSEPDSIVERLNNRKSSLWERLGHPPSFLPVSLQDVKDLAQYQLDNDWAPVYKIPNYQQSQEYCDLIKTSFQGVLPESELWTFAGIKLRQV